MSCSKFRDLNPNLPCYGNENSHAGLLHWRSELACRFITGHVALNLDVAVVGNNGCGAATSVAKFVLRSVFSEYFLYCPFSSLFRRNTAFGRMKQIIDKPLNEEKPSAVVPRQKRPPLEIKVHIEW